MEFGLTFLFLFGLLMPIADLGVAALQYMAAYQAMRDFGAYVQYHEPPDVTNWSGWKSSLPSISGYAISTSVMCGSTSQPCSAANTGSPKWFVFSTNITLNPFFLSALAGTYTIDYSERFQ
jgi:hypothetical protein